LGVRGLVLAIVLGIAASGPAHAAQLVAPGDGATVSTTPTFEWQLAPGERASTVRLARTDANPDPEHGRPAGDAQSYTVEDALAPGAHTWSLSYYDSASRLQETEIRKFTVAPPPLDKLKVDALPMNVRDEESDEFLTEDVFPERFIENTTTFDVTVTPHAAVGLAVSYRGKQVYAAALNEATSYDEELREGAYAWTCKRQGKHLWTVAAWDAYGGTKTRTGSFSVGRCGSQKTPVTRRTMIGYIEDEFRSDEFVSYIECDATSKLTKAGANTWRCVIVWNDFRRACGARYVFTHFDALRFGQSLEERYRARRETKLVCEQFAR
jgi:hypothetical protein